MRKKIEKLVFAGDLIENELERIRIKINKIIDYLNSQDQGEMIPVKDKDIDAERLKELVTDNYGKDTPEQKEEWEEELGKLMSTWGKVLFVNKGRIGAGMQTAMYLKFYHFIKDLLSEREMFTKEELFMLKLAINDIHNKGNSAYDEIGEKIKRELSK